MASGACPQHALRTCNKLEPNDNQPLEEGLPPLYLVSPNVNIPWVVGQAHWRNINECNHEILILCPSCNISMNMSPAALTFCQQHTQCHVVSVNHKWRVIVKALSLSLCPSLSLCLYIYGGLGSCPMKSNARQQPTFTMVPGADNNLKAPSARNRYG